jgi:hypothetical protein
LLHLGEFVHIVGIRRLELDMEVDSYFEDVPMTQKMAAFTFTHSIVIPKGPIQGKILGVHQWRYFLKVVLVEENCVDADMLV